MEWLAVAATAFALVVPVELPDKTFVVTLVLATRHRPMPVWLGVAAAFGVQCLVATAAGRLVGLLPQRPVKLAAAALFAVGAVVLVRQAMTAPRLAETARATRLDRPGVTGVRAAASSFLVLFAAEWGDLSQLLTAGLVASGKPAVPVFAGSWLGLVAVSGAAVLLGRALLYRVDAAVLRYAGATVCALLAGVTLWSAW